MSQKTTEVEMLVIKDTDNKVLEVEETTLNKQPFLEFYAFDEIYFDNFRLLFNLEQIKILSANFDKFIQKHNKDIQSNE